MDTDQAVNRTRHQMNVPGAFVLLLLLLSTIGCATVSDVGDTVVQPKPPNYTYLGLKPGSPVTGNASLSESRKARSARILSPLTSVDILC